jgi:hypothetical protein
MLHGFFERDALDGVWIEQLSEQIFAAFFISIVSKH